MVNDEVSHLVVKKVFRIGLVGLFKTKTKWFVAIKNRRYLSKVEIPEENVKKWKEELSESSTVKLV